LTSISSIYLVISFQRSETMHDRWQAFSEVHIFVNNSFQRWILWRIHPETDSTIKD
jgi:hypothetical protein